jgi:hypothetical protein
MSLSTQLTTLANDHLLDICAKYVDKWSFSLEWESLFDNIKRVFDVDDLLSVRERFAITNEAVIKLGCELSKRNLMNTKNDIDVLIKYNNLLEKIHYTELMINHYLHYKNTCNEGYDFNTNIDSTMFKFTPLNYEDMQPFQKLIFRLLDIFETKNYRKREDVVYEQIYVDTHGTHAWKKKCTIIEFIHEQCSMIQNLSNWYLVTSSKNMDKQLQEYFMRCNDKRFPSLDKNRNVFAFQNGIYFSISTAASGHPLATAGSGLHEDLFVPYDSSDFSLLNNDVTACKYFAQHFTHTEVVAKEAIATPHLDSIFNYQGISDEVLEINKMFLGRMLYDVGSMDNWQVILMLLGAGGTGKSTITNIVRMFYDGEDVGIMGNNFSKTFGLADIYDKFAFIAPEIKKDWGIDQAEFQEIVSGGKLNVNIKHQKSERVEWTAPGMLGGNENPGFVDNASSIQRRVVVTRFDKKVMDGDPALARKLELEVGNILKQCNMYYLHYVNEYKEKDLWSWVPEYFLQTQKLMAAASNALHAFLDSDVLILEPEAYIPMDEFFKRFNLYCIENNFTKPKLNVDFYRAPFNKYHIDVVKCSKSYPPDGGKMYKNTNFLIGVNVKGDDVDGYADY